MSTTPPALGDIQKQIQDKVAQIRARIAELKTQLPFQPPGFLDQPILQRGALQRGAGAKGQGRFGNMLQRRPLLMRSSTTSNPCPNCRPVPPPPPLQGAIVDGHRQGPSVGEDIDPVRFRLSVAT